jgi:hypothetical protein
MNINLGKIAKFAIQHADLGVKAVEAIKGVFTKGSDKKAAALDILQTAIVAGAELSDDEQQLALLPEVKQAYHAVIEANVAVMKARKELMDVLQAARAAYGR